MCPPRPHGDAPRARFRGRARDCGPLIAALLASLPATAADATRPSLAERALAPTDVARATTPPLATSARSLDELVDAGELGPDLDNDFADLDLEDLFAVEISSVAGVARPILGTPSAISRIGREDIERSGYRHLAEVLRLAPGVDVGRASQNRWAVSIRGFSSLFANKQQVLIDDRSVYLSAFSGVLWETHDLPLDEVEAIEVVRGPGATIWGENAVNGVINVTTRSAFDTQGFLARVGGGTSRVATTDLRYGDLIDDDTAWRVSVRASELGANAVAATGADAADDSLLSSVSARLDHRLGDGTVFTVSGRGFNVGRLGRDARTPVPAHLTFIDERRDDRIQGGHLRTRLQHTREDGTGWLLQASYDRLETTRPEPTYIQDGIDVRARSSWSLDGGATLSWGAHAQSRRSQLPVAPNIQPVGEFDRWDHLVSTYVQYETPVAGREDLTAIVGSKFSHNDFSGFEVQPSARLAWMPSDDFAAWGAVSRAVRTPSVLEHGLDFIGAYADTGLLGGGPPSSMLVPIGIGSNPDMDAEVLIAWEAGIRWRPHETLTLDVAGYVNDFDDLRVVNAGGINLNLGNNGSGTVWGGELEATWQPVDTWRLTGSWTLLQADLEADRPVTFTEATSPQQIARLRSSWQLTDAWRFDTVGEWVDERVSQAASGITDRFRLDAGLTWTPDPNVQLSIWGRNLLSPAEPEFVDTFFSPRAVAIERDVFVELTLRF